MSHSKVGNSLPPDEKNNCMVNRSTAVKKKKRLIKTMIFTADAFMSYVKQRKAKGTR